MQGWISFTCQDMVKKVHHSELRDILESMPKPAAALYLRQSCVMPDDEDHIFASWRGLELIGALGFRLYSLEGAI